MSSHEQYFHMKLKYMSLIIEWFMESLKYFLNLLHLEV